MSNRRISVLLTSVANKVSLVRLFQRSQRELGMPQSVIGVDIDRYVAGLYAADAGYLVPRLDDPAYERRVDDIVAEHGIGLIVPTRDEDVQYFAERRDRFAEMGVRVNAPSAEIARTCFDKWAFYEFLVANGLPAIDTWLDASLFDGRSAVIKPRTGKGGRGITILQDPDAWPHLKPGYILQEFVCGDEYTIDYFADFDANPICVVPRRRFRVADGESKVGITCDLPEMASECRRLGRALGLVGHSTIQCFLLEGGGLKFVEVNPRFGGGAPLGIAAGCNGPEFLLRICLGETLAPRHEFEVGLVMLRHSTDLFVSDDQVASL